MSRDDERFARWLMVWALVIGLVWAVTNITLHPPAPPAQSSFGTGPRRCG